MEILLVLVVLAVVAGAAFLYMRSRDGVAAGASRGRGPALRGRRRTRAATRHDPMADAVERHAQATDPHEAAEAELRLQAQANRVASDLHAQQASELESQARGRVNGQGVNGVGRPAHESAETLPEQEGGPAYHDEQGRPVYPEDRPRY